MAEEVKQEKNAGKNIAGMMIKVILGLALLAVGAYFVYRWWPPLLLVIKAGIGPFCILAGLITLAIAKE
ncbi:MAG: hypothetical protein KBA46_02835 [Candidatus Omnitrophica bacterium]|nr:hypothetical protein [Candidatus Omnitrophota bacterium]